MRNESPTPRRRWAWPVFAGLAFVGILVAHWLAFVYAPVKAPELIDQAGGVAHRIMYFHVPSAWLCYLGFIVCFVGSVRYLWGRQTRADILAVAGAEVGLLFGTIVLTTGPLWARAAWGTWWRWEPRLTSMLLLYLVFAAYYVLRAYGGQTEGVRKFGAVLAVFGTPNIFFVHYAVKKWRGDHPDGVATGGGLGAEQRIALYGTLLVFIVVFVLLVRLRYRVHEDALTARALRRRLARLGGA